MYTAIRNYDEQAFDNMSEENEKKTFIIKKSLRPVPSQGIVEQAKKHGDFRPQWGYRGNALRLKERGGRGSPNYEIMPLIIFKRGVLINPNT